MNQLGKTLNSGFLIMQNSDCHLLYDPELLSVQFRNFLSKPLDAGLLNADFLQHVTHSQQITTGGRGQAWFVELGEVSAVYRKYQRGGLIARVNQQIYIGLNVENSRSFKEWRLLHWMVQMSLPVPQPIAASVCRTPFGFSPFYQAQILVKRIPNIQTLDQALCLRQLTEAEWRSIGDTIRLFHNAGVYHADLNANNILLNDKSLVYLIDFDKGELRDVTKITQQWMKDNLSRLKRSLLKQQGIHKHYYFSEENWQMLVLGYDG